MIKTRAGFAVATTTTYLLVYCILLQIESLQQLGIGMFTLSPVVLIWMVYSVLRYGRYTGRELEAGEEFGYEEPGIDGR